MTPVLSGPPGWPGTTPATRPATDHVWTRCLTLSEARERPTIELSPRAFLRVSPTRPLGKETSMPVAPVKNGLEIYLKQIDESKLLTPKEEKELCWKIMHENCPAARERMIRS